jgi:hypothetical protein
MGMDLFAFFYWLKRPSQLEFFAYVQEVFDVPSSLKYWIFFGCKGLRIA